MENGTVQFNVDLPEEIMRQVRMDCARNNLSQRQLAEVALADWFKQRILERAKKYEREAK